MTIFIYSFNKLKKKMSRFPDRQFDIHRIHNDHTALPLGMPYRLDATDFVFFNFPDNFPVNDYSVVVESASNASPNPSDRFRNIGKFQKRVELPNVHFSKGFGSAAKIGVIPTNNPNLTSYIGTIVRGGTYTIDYNAQVLTSSGHKIMHRTGGVI